MPETPISASGADPRQRARSILKSSSAFAGCPDSVIDELMARAVVTKFGRGDTMYRQGGAGDSLAVVLSGSLKATNDTAEGKEVVMGFLKSGALIGEIALLDGGDRSANVVALEAVEAVFIYRRDLVQILRRNPDALFTLIEGLCARLRQTITLVESYSLETSARVAAALLRLAAEHGQTVKGTTTINLKLNQSDLGGHLGLARETVSRTFGDLRDSGIIQMRGSLIVILDKDRLADLADGSPK